MSTLLFVGQFVASKVGATGLTVTVDVDRYTLADGTRTALVTGGSATEGRRGLYHYRLANADLALYQYVCTFVTSGTADQQEVPALGLVVPDELVGSRLATTGYTAPDNASVTAIKAQTDKLAFTGSDVKATLDGETVALAGNVTVGGYAAGQAPLQPGTAGRALLVDAAGRVEISGSAKNTLSELYDALLVALQGADATATLTALKTLGAAVRVKTDNLPASPAATGAAMTLTAATVDSIQDGLSILTAQDVRDAMKLAPSAGDPAEGSVDQHLDTAASAGDPWSTALPGAYQPNQAGYIIGRLKTLDVSAPTVISQIDGGTLTVIAGATFDPEALDDLVIPAAWTTGYFTVKVRKPTPDATAVVQIKVSNPAAVGDGLRRLNGGATTADWGALALDAAAGTATILLADEATALLGAGTNYYWDIKTLNADGSSDVVCSGLLQVLLTPTQAI